MIKELDYMELEVLIEETTQKLREEMIIANRCGTLEETLKKHDLIYDEQEKWYWYPNTSKMIVIGSAEVKKKDILGCLKYANIDEKRVELYIMDYEKLDNINFGFLRNNCGYTDVLACGMPHKMKEIGDNPSFISMIENNPKEYPPLIRITDECGRLKFSNTAFKKALLKTNMYKEIHTMRNDFV